MAKEEARGDGQLSRNEVNRQKASMELDLIAFFKLAEEGVSEAMARAVREGKSGEQVIEAGLAVLDT